MYTDNDTQDGGNGGVDRKIAHGGQSQIDEDAREPEPEVGEEMHHGIEDDRRGSMLRADVLRQLHDAVRFTTQSANRCSIVQGIAGNGEPIDTPKANLLAVDITLTLDDGKPRPCVDAIDKHPYTNDGNEPVTSMTEVLPQLHKADVEGEKHNHTGQYSNDEEQVVELLFSPLHENSQCTIRDGRPLPYRKIRDGG